MIIRALMMHFARHRAAVYQLRARHLLRSLDRSGGRPRFVRGQLLSSSDVGTEMADGGAFQHAARAEGIAWDTIRELQAEPGGPAAEDRSAPPTHQTPISRSLAHVPAVARASSTARPAAQQAAPAAPEQPKGASQRPTMDELRDTLLQLRARTEQAPTQPAEPSEPLAAPGQPARARPSLGRRVEHLPDIVKDPPLPTRRPAEAAIDESGPIHPEVARQAPPEPLPEDAPKPTAQSSDQEDISAGHAQEQARAETQPADTTRDDSPSPAQQAQANDWQAAMRSAEQPQASAAVRPEEPQSTEHSPAAPAPEIGQPLESNAGMPDQVEATADTHVSAGDLPAALDQAPMPLPDQNLAPRGTHTDALASRQEPDQPDTAQQSGPELAASRWVAEHTDTPDSPRGQTGAARLPQDALALQQPAVHSPAAAGQVAPPSAVPGAPASEARAIAPAVEQKIEPDERPASAPSISAAVDRPTAPAHEAPEPMRPSTRRFLSPILGFDPSNTRIYRGPQAGQIATAHQAEAVTQGDQIILSEIHASDTSEALAVLAHELTHVARRRLPRFVPPIARIGDGAARMNDEEHLALLVEARTAAVARRRFSAPDAAAALDAASLPPDRPPMAGLTGPQDHDAPMQEAPASAVSPAAAPSTTPPSTPPISSRLPEPWEPLPAWIPTSRRAQPTPTAASPTAQQAVSSAPARLPQVAAPPAAPIQRAALNRSLPERLSPANPAPMHPQPSASQPTLDLDALAQQIYAMIRQRLANERRRLG